MLASSTRHAWSCHAQGRSHKHSALALASFRISLYQSTQGSKKIPNSAKARSTTAKRQQELRDGAWSRAVENHYPPGASHELQHQGNDAGPCRALASKLWRLVFTNAKTMDGAENEHPLCLKCRADESSFGVLARLAHTAPMLLISTARSLMSPASRSCTWSSGLR